MGKSLIYLSRRGSIPKTLTEWDTDSDTESQIIIAVHDHGAILKWWHRLLKWHTIITFHDKVTHHYLVTYHYKVTHSYKVTHYYKLTHHYIEKLSSLIHILIKPLKFAIFYYLFGLVLELSTWQKQNPFISPYSKKYEKY